MLGVGTGLDPSGDVLTHHDGVVNNDAGGEHESEQDQAVQVGSAQPHQHQAAHQGHRYGNAGDHRQPPAPQEQHQHQQHQQHRIPQRGEGAIQVGLHVVGHIHNHRQLHARRKARRQLFELCLHRAAHRDGIGSIPLIQPHRHRALTVQVHGLTVVTALSQGHAPHILQPQQATVVEPTQHQIFEILLAAQATIRLHRQGDQLSRWRWCGADAADGRQHVLLGQGPVHIGDRQVGLLQPVRIEPQAKGEFAAAEHPHVPNAGCAQQGFPHGLVQPAPEKGGHVLVGWVAEAQDHQQVIG